MIASQSTPAAFLFITWGVTTVVLVALLSYRATLSSHGHQKFSDPSKRDHNQEETAVIAKRSRVAVRRIRRKAVKLIPGI